ncbi:hypothetical protein JW992_08035 [candidate division KSB1 bacterium]|nr:hypothetical protein [candidate division KSB1 bacterium]
MTLKIFQMVLLLSAVVFAQETPLPDTLRRSEEIPQVMRAGEFEEQVLETINIEAIIEKPSVTFVPKRAETQVGSLPLEHRSFEEEMRQKPDVVSEYGQDLEGGKRIKKIKKLLAKEGK